MEIGDRQQVGLARRQPAFFRQGLALRAVPVPTGVVRDADGAAMITRLRMPAERGGATRRDRAQRPVLDRGESMRTRIGRAMDAHDVGQLQPGDASDRRAGGHGAHGSGLRRWSQSLQQIER